MNGWSVSHLTNHWINESPFNAILPRMPSTLLEKSLIQFRIRLSRYWLLLLALFPLLVALGCLKFNFSSYEGLRNGYLKLCPCLYKYWEWDQAFFSRATCENGKRFCWFGLIISLNLSFLAFRKFRKTKSSKIIDVSLLKGDAICLAILYAWAAGQWIYGFKTSYPAYDEVFSAVNCAGLHPFQTASYYMLPNNHIFFNLVNHFLGPDPSSRIVTGRILAGIAFAILIPFLFFWLKRKTNSRFYATLFCALMFLQFPVWGFSFQARGYSFLLLCAWVSFITLDKYLKDNYRPTLWLHAACIIIGLWSVPTFLFWEVALLLYFGVSMIAKKRLDWPGVQTHLIAGATVFLVYLPVICFSGLGAILENRYVVSQKNSLVHYLPEFWNAFQSAIQYCFSGFVDDKTKGYQVLFFIPVLLYPFLRRTRIASALNFYLALWLAFTGLEFYIQRFPFMRNMNAHVSFTLAAVLLCGRALLQRILQNRMIWLQRGAIILFCFALGLHYMRFNFDHINDSLYFYQADRRFKVLDETTASLPQESKVWVSDEGFYWEFLCKRHGLQASMCFDRGTATHYIKMETEKLPPSLEGNVEKIRQTDEYEIYRVLSSTTGTSGM
jgi:hypothetical protein